MPSCWDKCIYCSPFAEPLNIDDVLTPNSFSDEDEGVEIDIADPAWTAEQQIEIDEALLSVAAFIAGLSPREQEIVHRIFWLGETQASIARSLGVTRMAISKTVKKITKLGRVQVFDLYDCALVH